MALIDLLNTYIFIGVAGNFAWDAVKHAWLHATHKSWEDLYVNAFKAAVEEERPRLAKYVAGRDVALDRDQLVAALAEDIAIPLGTTPLSQLSSDEYLARLSQAMAERGVLILEGNNLSEDDYEQLVRTTAKHATALFIEGILKDEPAFRRALLQEALSNHQLLESAQHYLSERFSITLASLEAITNSISGLRRHGCWVVDEAFIGEAREEAKSGMPSMYERLGHVAMRHIVAGQDVRRRPTGTLLAATKALRGATGMRFHLLRAKGGNGKSSFLWRLAYELFAAGEYVLLSRYGESPDEEVLRRLCAEVNSSGVTVGDPGTPPKPRRVCLLLDNAYVDHMSLLRNLDQLGIPNLTVIAVSRYSDIVPGAPQPGMPLVAGPKDLPNLDLREAMQLVHNISTCGALRLSTSDAKGAVELNISGHDPLLVTVARLTSTSLDTYVLTILTEINDGKNPLTMKPDEWSPFLRLYYGIALCHAWGVAAPQQLLPALTQLTPQQVRGLLCKPGPDGVLVEPSEQAQEYLQGACSGFWTTDHELIAATTIRLLTDTREEGLDHLKWLFSTLADLVSNANLQSNAAMLAARLFRRCADTPTLVFPADTPMSPLDTLAPIDDEFSLTEEPATKEHKLLAEALDDPVLITSLARLEEATTSVDLATYYLPAYTRLCRWGDAQRVAAAALADNQLNEYTRASIWASKAVVYESAKQNREAEADYTRALELWPDFPDALAGRGRARAALRRHEKALADYDRALELRPNDPEILASRAFSCLQLDLEDQALENAERSVRLKPDGPNTLNHRGLVYKDLGRYDDALTDFNRADEIKPDLAATYSNRGLTYYTRGVDLARSGHTNEAREDYDRSLTDLNRALGMSPNDPEALTGRGNTLSALGQERQALADFDHSLQIRPDDALTLNNRGHSRTRLGDYSGALKDYNRSLKLRPNHAQTINNRGGMYVLMRQPKMALKDFKRALKILSTQQLTRRTKYLPTEIILNRAMAYYDLGWFEDAVKDYTKGLEEFPDNPTLSGNRGLANTHLQRFAEAETDLVRMRSKEPDSASTHYTMACYHSLRGDAESAVSSLAAAIAKDRKYVEMARNDQDFNPIRQYPPFVELISHDLDAD